jgi:hypothetical protein
MKEKNNVFASLKSLKKGVGSGVGSGAGFISQRYRSAQNVMEPQHWLTCVCSVDMAVEVLGVAQQLNALQHAALQVI